MVLQYLEDLACASQLGNVGVKQAAQRQLVSINLSINQHMHQPARHSHSHQPTCAPCQSTMTERARAEHWRFQSLVLAVCQRARLLWAAQLSRLPRAPNPLPPGRAHAPIHLAPCPPTCRTSYLIEGLQLAARRRARWCLHWCCGRWALGAGRSQGLTPRKRVSPAVRSQSNRIAS